MGFGSGSGSEFGSGLGLGLGLEVRHDLACLVVEEGQAAGSAEAGVDRCLVKVRSRVRVKAWKGVRASKTWARKSRPYYYYY